MSNAGYQLRITLLHLKPKIWRRIVVPSELKLHQLHDVIQRVMGWTNSHLHMFICGEERFSARFEPGDLEELEAVNETKVRLCTLLRKPKATMQYDYDFGDGWEHEVLLEKIIPMPEGSTAKLEIVDGEMACPPDDCGGPFGYADLVAAYEDPDHPDRKELLAWAGESFDPQRFELKKIQAKLNAYQRKLNERKRRK